MVRLVLFLLILITHGSATGQFTLGSAGRNVYDVAVSDSLLAAVTDNSIELWNVRSKKQLFSVAYTSMDILSAVCFAPENYTLITGSRAGEIAVWDLTTGAKTIRLLPGVQGTVTALDKDRDEKFLAAGFTENKTTVYDLSNFQEVFSFDQYTRAVTAVRFANSENVLASASGDGQVIMHDLNSKESKIIARYSGWVRSMTFSPDSSNLAVSGDSGKLYIRKNNNRWSDATVYLSVRNNKDWITSTDYHPKDRECIVTGTVSGNIEISTVNARYSYNVHSIVNTLKVVPEAGGVLQVAVATMGKGLILLRADKMKLGSGNYRY